MIKQKRFYSNEKKGQGETNKQKPTHATLRWSAKKKTYKQNCL